MRHILLRILIFAIIACIPAAAAACSIGRAVSLQPETLRYDVMFKWGLINKKAGEATLQLEHGPQHYHARLTAHSAPWADRIYRVRDTLIGRMSLPNFTPLYYEKIAHEGNEHKHDVVNYDYSEPGTVRGICTRRVFKRNVLKIDEQREMTAENRALDMLTSFYYMRSLPFEEWTPGQTESIDIFSGKQKELLTIRYMGIDEIETASGESCAYHVRFIFTSGGGRKSSDDMDAWIATGPDRTPLKLEGKLPVGKVRCILAD